MNKIASSNLLGKLFGTFQKESQANYDFHWRHSTGLCWQGKAQQVSVNGYVSSLFVVRSTFVFSHYRYLWVPAICRVLFNKLSQIIFGWVVYYVGVVSVWACQNHAESDRQWFVRRFSHSSLLFAGDARRSTEAAERHEREHWILSEESSGTGGMKKTRYVCWRLYLSFHLIVPRFRSPHSLFTMTDQGTFHEM